jgi:hypothetical protein
MHSSAAIRCARKKLLHAKQSRSLHALLDCSLDLTASAFDVSAAQRARPAVGRSEGRRGVNAVNDAHILLRMQLAVSAGLRVVANIHACVAKGAASTCECA